MSTSRCQQGQILFPREEEPPSRNNSLYLHSSHLRNGASPKPFSPTPAKRKKEKEYIIRLNKMATRMSISSLTLRFIHVLGLVGCQAEVLQQVFRVEPENVTILEGDTALLKCEVENPTGTVQWVKDGLLLGPNWTIPRFPRYSMMGDTSKGEILEKYKLASNKILPKSPLFVEYEANSLVTWIAGTEYTLCCQVKDARPPAEITFSKGETLIFPSIKGLILHNYFFFFMFPSRFTPQSSDNKELLTCKAASTVTLTPVFVSFTMNILCELFGMLCQAFYPGLRKCHQNNCTRCSGQFLLQFISRNWETDDTSQLSRSSLSLKITPEDNMAVVSCQALNQLLSLPLQSSIVLSVTFPPEQVKIIGSSSTEENKEIFLTCSTSTSNPPVMLRWWLGWRELNATETTISEAEYGGMVAVSNLTYIAYREDNDLPLICEAFNEAIMYTTSASVTLRVKYPPQKIWLNVPPPETYFRAGVEIKLICFASGGNPLPRLDWYKVPKHFNQWWDSNFFTTEYVLLPQDIKLVREGTSSASSGNVISKELLLITTPSDNMATYQCNATGPPRTPALTAYTSLLVQFPPLHATIIATDKKVRRGQSVTLTCKSGSSNPPPHLTWLKDGKKLDGINLGQRKAEYGGFSASERVTLVVSSADHGKRVECYAYSSVLSEGVNTFYQLTILFPPEFSPEQTHLVEAAEHGSAQLPLLVSAYPPEITYHWSFLGEMILTEGSPRYHLRNGGSLEIWNVTRADAGKYRIYCENAEGQNETTITLNVRYSPSIRSITDPTYVDLGETAEIVCQADANPVPNFQWRWLGDLERSLEDLGFKLLSEGLVGTLMVQEAQRTHAGLYECQVDNGISPAAKSSARLIVRYQPEIIKGPGQRKVAASGDGRSQAVLQCSAQGVPSVLFSWAKNGVSLDPQSPRYSVVTSYEDSLHTSTLTIANVSAMLDYAIFTCTANNNLGTDAFDIQLLSTSRPDPPTEFKVVSVAHNWLALEWIPGFDGGLQQSFRAPSFLYVDVFPPQSPTFTLTGLQPNTPYNVSVNARNALGESDFADGGGGLSISTEGKGSQGSPDQKLNNEYQLCFYCKLILTESCKSEKRGEERAGVGAWGQPEVVFASSPNYS
uniref:NPHS1 adhesion molecule, nephrin n=1 Tax=Laticauda laticaudata TaxID=8630 RepID=A0A8C5SW59_LATLA